MIKLLIIRFILIIGIILIIKLSGVLGADTRSALLLYMNVAAVSLLAFYFKRKERACVAFAF